MRRRGSRDAHGSVRLFARLPLPAGIFGLCLVGLIAMPTVSQAKGPVLAPPTNSGIAEYVETIPTDRGGRPSNSLTGRPNGSAALNRANPGDVIAPTTLNALTSDGANGRAAVALAVAAAPGRARSRPGRHRGAASSDPAFRPGVDGESPLAAVIAAITGQQTDGGMGIAIVLIPALIVIVFGAVAVTRHRRG